MGLRVTLTPTLNTTLRSRLRLPNDTGIDSNITWVNPHRAGARRRTRRDGGQNAPVLEKNEKNVRNLAKKH